MDNMSHVDIGELIAKHGTQTIIDLRSSIESQALDCPIDEQFPTRSTKEQLKTGRQKYRVDFTGWNFKWYCVFLECSWYIKIVLCFLMLFGQKRRATYVVGRNILTPMGVPALYKAFVTYCHTEILEALTIFLYPENYPIHIHCTQGKDRTGVLVCFLMCIAGVPHDTIVRDYALTQLGMAPLRDEMLEETKRAGLSEEFVDSPPQNMREFLDFLVEQYGSVEAYLNLVGFNQEKRNRVRQIICE
ncbi:hypothetical protein DFQ28_007017 [Apophysomyces sp. BC1034]|nr:hypothetical protein DFQ28_007017 [Apophysomyces sp. BC1034]